MQTQLNFNKFATALAALGATSLTVSAASASSVRAWETPAAQIADEKPSPLGDEDDDKKKKKKKDDGDEGGCGAGTCG